MRELDLTKALSSTAVPTHRARLRVLARAQRPWAVWCAAPFRSGVVRVIG